ncbi:MAG: preprotein translocase subunit SecY [Patescibacteria group bacterium]
MNWKLIGRGLRNSEMRSKVIAVLGMLLVYRLLAHIPIPLAEPAELKQILDNLLSDDSTPQLLSFINVLSGGALASLSIMLVGLGPYINASIIMQVLTKAIPKLEALQKEGEYGTKKINQYTRILTFPLAIIQSIGILYLVGQIAGQIGGLGNVVDNASLSQWVLMVAALTGGAMILMWLGELVTEKGIGNGISLLITVGIVSQLPFIISALFQAIVDDQATMSIFGWFDLPINTRALVISAILTAATVLLTVFVVYLNEAQRRIKITYAKKVQGNRAYSDVNTVLPVKLITAGVVPIIFAVAFLSVPQLAGSLLEGNANPSLASLGETLVRWFQVPGTHGSGAVFVDIYSLIYPTVYFLLVVAFTFFYTGVVFNSKEISESLQRQGGFIEGVRPGDDTRKYLSKVVNRLNFFGAASLGFLAITPILGQAFLGNSQLAIGGTSILILVAVSLETLRKVESKALMVTYEDYEHDFNASRGETDKKADSKEKPKKSIKNFFTTKK